MSDGRFFVRSSFNYDPDQASRDSGFRTTGHSVVQQSGKDDADINTIVRRFGLTGQLPPGSVRAPQFGDFTAVTDFHSALNAVARANESFDALPADVRARFVNDPQKLLEFCADPANLKEAVKLGLAMPKEASAEPVGATTVPGSTPAPSVSGGSATAP